MSLVAPQVSNTLLLKYMLNNVAPSNVEIHLYANSFTPHESCNLTNFTETTAPSPYTPVVLTGSQWTVAAGSPSGSTATFSTVQFNFSTSTSVYGYFVTDAGKANLLWAEIFTGSPFSIPSSGGSVQVTPRISCD